MLQELLIRNVALIRELRIEFGPGLNVLTGETGAGKSILLGSLNLALGGRSDREMIRSDADRADVQAVFELPSDPDLLTRLDEIGADTSEGSVIISREIRSSGKSVSRISGVIVPLSTLKEITSHLMDLHGQHEHQTLLDPSRHLSLLDSFAGAEIRPLKDSIATLYRERTERYTRYKRITTEAAERARQIDMLSFQIAEIDAVKPKHGEESKLEQRALLLENAEKVRDDLLLASDALSGEGSGICDRLGEAEQALRHAAKFDEGLKDLPERLQELMITAKDIAYELRDRKEQLVYDPEAAERVYDRLDHFRKLERKYGETIEDVISFADQAREKLGSLQEEESGTEDLKHELKQIDRQLRQACTELSAIRHAAAQRLADGVGQQLHDLGMADARFGVSFEECKPTAEGIDRVEFMISANRGEPEKPIAQVASGGELSRIMLAIKTIAADLDGVDSMVFDEIDTGVSGKVAQAVGEKMRSIAGKRQVLCVTHLAQIAAMGRTHFLVEKKTEGDSTDSTVRKLDRTERCEEVARLLGGGADSPTAMEHARHLIESAAGIL